MYQIDEISRVLGELKSDINYIRKATDEGNGKIDTLTSASITQGESIKAAWKRIDNIQPHVDDYVNLKNKGVGILCSVGGICTVIGYGVSKAIEYLGKHI